MDNVIIEESTTIVINLFNCPPWHTRIHNWKGQTFPLLFLPSTCLQLQSKGPLTLLPYKGIAADQCSRSSTNLKVGGSICKP